MQPGDSLQVNEKAWYTIETQKWKATTNSKHNLPVAPNLLNQNFDVKEPNTMGRRYYLPLDQRRLALYSHC